MYTKIQKISVQDPPSLLKVQTHAYIYNGTDYIYIGYTSSNLCIYIHLESLRYRQCTYTAPTTTQSTCASSYLSFNYDLVYTFTDTILFKKIKLITYPSHINKSHNSQSFISKVIVTAEYLLNT